MAKSRKVRCARRGFTLMELAISMAIFAIVSVAVTNVLRAAVEAQMNQRTMAYQEQIAMDVMDALRMDLRYASNVNVSANTVTFTTFDTSTATSVPTEIDVTYTFTGTAITRTAPSGTRDFTANTRPQMGVACGAPCFQASGAPVKRVTINNLQIVDTSPANSVLDAQFGKATFRVTEASFDILEAEQFQ